jgi:hypothetical protein
MHLHIGLKISRFREVDNDYSCSEVAAMINANRLTARLMELGLHDFKLSELLTIADVVKLPLAELIGYEPEAKQVEQPQRNYDNSRVR